MCQIQLIGPTQWCTLSTVCPTVSKSAPKYFFKSDFKTLEKNVERQLIAFKYENDHQYPLPESKSIKKKYTRRMWGQEVVDPLRNYLSLFQSMSIHLHLLFQLIIPTEYATCMYPVFHAVSYVLSLHNPKFYTMQNIALRDIYEKIYIAIFQLKITS